MENMKENHRNKGNKPKTTNKPTSAAKTSSHTTAGKQERSNNTTQTKGVKKKQTAKQIPDYTDDESSVDDGMDYTKEENYAVKKFIGHQEIQKKKKGGKDIQLITRWRGWRDKDSITFEPLTTMIQDWPKEVRRYCEKNKEFEEICKAHEYGHLLLFG
jgi:hypothetical protein